MHRFRASLAGFLVVAATGWNFANVGPAAELLSDAYGTGLGTIGLLVSALVLVHTAMNIPAGRLTDALGAPRVVIAGCLVIIVTNVVVAVAPDLPLAFGMRLLSGIGTATGFVAAAHYVRVVTRSPLAQGLVGGGAMAGAGLALAIVPALEGAGWRAPYLSSAAVACLALAAFSAAPLRHLAPPRSDAPATSIASLLRDARLYRVGTIHVFSMGTSIVVGTWVVTLLTEEAGYRTATAGLVGSVVLLAGIVTRPGGGWIRHRHPLRTRSAVQASLAVGGLGTIVLALAPPVAVALPACVAIGLAAGLPFAPAFEAAAALRPDAPAAAVGLVNMLANLFVLVVTPIVGACFALANGGRIAVAVVGALWVAAALAVPRAPGLGLVATAPPVESPQEE